MILWLNAKASKESCRLPTGVLDRSGIVHVEERNISVNGEDPGYVG